MATLIGRRPFLLLAGSSLLAGCAARAMGSSPPASDASAPPPTIGPAAAWNGTPGSGYSGSRPTDPARTTAKPALLMQHAWGQAFSTNLTIGVDSEAVGGVKKVICHCEGTSVDLYETVLVDTDVNNLPRRRVGYWVTLDASLFAKVSTAGGIDVYFEAIPNDLTMQHRVIGPDIPVYDPSSGAATFMGCGRFYPRGASATVAAGANPDVYGDQVYKVAASGAGGAYRTYGAAIAAAVAANATAANIHFVESGTYETDDCSAFQSYNKSRGFWVVDAAPNVNVILRRATYMVADDGPSQWCPGPNGIEFRGAGIVIDYKNISYIGVSYQLVFTDNLQHRIRFNGCRVTNTTTPAPGGADPLESYYWHKRPRPQGLAIEGGFLEGATFEYLCGALSNVILARNCYVRHTIFSVAAATQYVAGNYVSNTSQNFFFTSEDQMSLAYSGSGTATAYTSGGYMGLYGASYFLHLAVNGVDVKVFQLGRIESDTYFNWSAIANFVNGSMQGWTAALIRSPVTGLTDNRSTISCGLFGTITVNATPQAINSYFDFHEDFEHGVDAENVIYRGNIVIGDSYTAQGAIGLTAFRFDFAAKDFMGLDNCFYVAQSSGNSSGGIESHVYMRGNSYAREGWSPGGAWDNYCRFEDNVQSLYWTAGTITTPLFKNNYITSQVPGSAPAVASAPNLGNLVAVFQGDYAGQKAANTALFVNPAAGDYRPAGAAIRDMKPRAGKYDGLGYPRDATLGDAPGAWSKNTPKPVWPF